MEQKIIRIINSIGKACLVDNFERVFNGLDVEGNWTDNSIKTRTTNIRRIINEGWIQQSLLIIENSKIKDEYADKYKSILVKLELI